MQATALVLQIPQHQEEPPLFEWYEDWRIIVLGIIIVLVIVLDEIAYLNWKKVNPGAMYSHLRDKTLTPVDPSRPPSTIYYE